MTLVHKGVSQYLHLLWQMVSGAYTSPEECFVVMDINHWGIHGGFFYSMVKLITLGVDATYTMLIKTGSEDIHMKPLIIESNEEQILFKAYEDPTVTVEGTTLPIFNRNRNMADEASTTLFYHTPTVTDIGTLIDVVYASGGSGVPTFSFGSIMTSNAEWFLKSDSYYYLTVTNNGNDIATINLKFIWGERPV